MAMLHREPNRVKWVGVRPGHDGTQVAKQTGAVNGTSIIHTVTAGKTLFVVMLQVTVDVYGAGKVDMPVRNGADVVQYCLNGIWVPVNGVVAPSIAMFNPPIEIPAGWDICIRSTALLLTASGFIFGWEE